MQLMKKLGSILDETAMFLIYYRNRSFVQIATINFREAPDKLRAGLTKLNYRRPNENLE